MPYAKAESCHRYFGRSTYFATPAAFNKTGPAFLARQGQ